MRCPQCQQETSPDAQFCPECGLQLEVICPSCEAVTAATDKFCRKCGQSLPPLVVQEAAARFASPEAYTPRPLAERIRSSRAALEGERKQVTVLFADLKDSMELLANRDPEEARRLLDPVLELMMEAVHRYEGTVNQVMGDGIMALFGAPLAHEDHAVRACYAALAMQAALGQLNEGMRRSHGVDVQMRIGLNAGEVVVRAIGSDLRMDYSAVGQTTHLAARMEQLAPPGSIRLTAETLRLAEGLVHTRALGAIPIRGLPDPVEVFELIGAAPLRTRMQAAAARGLTPFVGRQRELTALGEALERASRGRGEVLAIVGEPGVGKSRLVWELTHSPRMQGWLLLESGSTSYAKANAYRPLIDLLKAYFQIENRDDVGSIREKITGKLLSLDPNLRPVLPVFLTLLDVPVEDPEWLSLDPPRRRQRTLETCRHLLLRESQRQPLLLVFEDLHWIDMETQAFLDGLVENLPTARLLLVMTYRPGYQQTWAGKTYYSQLRLDPLPSENAEELLAALVGDDPGLQALRQLLIERTEGNPFFLEESVRALMETHILVGERGTYRLATDPSGIQVPMTVHAVLAARIDRLPSDEKWLLQVASVIGKTLPFALLQAITGLPEEALRLHLSHLVAVELLFEARLFPDLEYTFKHTLTHEVAYRSILLERRRLLHAEIVEAVERLYRARLAEHVELLAYHALRGELWEKAVQYLRQAGAKAADRSAYRSAVMFFREALSAGGHLESLRDRLRQGIDLRFEIRNALWALGELAQGLDYLRQAEPLAEQLGDQRRLARLSAHKSSNYLVLGHNERALESGQRTLSIARALNDFALQVDANQFMGVLYTSLGDYERAIEFLRTNVEMLVNDRRRGRFGEFYAVHARTWLAWCLAELGRFREANDWATESIQIADASNHPHYIVAANWAAGYLDRTRGNLSTAVETLARAYGLCQAASVTVWFRPCAALLGHAYALSGRLADALPLLEQAVKPGENNVALASWETHLAEAYMLAGRPDDAADVARHALGLARDRKERGFEAHALRLIAHILARRHQIEDAAEQYHEALALATDLGMRPLVARCQFGLGMLCRRAAKPELADEHLRTAADLYRQMNTRPWSLEPDTPAC